jgi:hypothetical protein
MDKILEEYLAYRIMHIFLKNGDIDKADFDTFDKIACFSSNPAPYLHSFTGKQELLLNIKNQIIKDMWKNQINKQGG